MLIAARKHHRTVWLTGAALLGVVMAKCFWWNLIAQRLGGAIISFVGVACYACRGLILALPPAREFHACIPGRFSLFFLLVFAKPVAGRGTHAQDFAFWNADNPVKDARPTICRCVARSYRSSQADCRIYAYSNASGMPCRSPCRGRFAPSPAHAHGTELPLFPCRKDPALPLTGSG